MATTYPLPTLAATVTAAGIQAPTYEDILASLQASYRQLFGSDIYIEPDSQDGQLLGLFALAIADCNATAVAVYNSFRPGGAVGEGLSSIVAINGLTRIPATRSTVDVTVVGTVGTTINGGQVRDAAGAVWNLPNSVTIPGGGSIVVTATADQPGAVQAPIGTVNQIATPQSGWASVTNPTAAVPGTAAESDAQLRLRQQVSTELPALSTSLALLAAVRSVTGVTQASLYENDTDAVDANGLPEHSVAMVVTGGDSTVIAQTMLTKKTPGCFFAGTTSVSVTDSVGQLNTVRFYRPTAVTINVRIELTGLTGYTTDTTAKIRAAMVAHVNALPTGTAVSWARMFVPAQLLGDPDADRYRITLLQISRGAGALGVADVPIAFNEEPVSVTGNIAIIVST